MTGTKFDAAEEMKSAIGYDELMEVLDFYNIKVVRKRCLCPFPGHNDKHIGNCAVFDDGHVHCFACGESADAIKLVSIFEGLGFMDAIEFLWTKILGRQLPEAFHAKSKNNTKLHWNDMRFIGLFSANGKYVRTYVSGTWSEETELPTGRFVDRQAKDEDGLYPVYEKQRVPSVFELLGEDHEAAKWLLLGKCRETRSFYESRLRDLRNPKTEQGSYAMTDPEFMKEARAYYSSQIQRAKSLYNKIESLR